MTSKMQRVMCGKTVPVQENDSLQSVLLYHSLYHELLKVNGLQITEVHTSPIQRLGSLSWSPQILYLASVHLFMYVTFCLCPHLGVEASPCLRAPFRTLFPFTNHIPKCQFPPLHHIGGALS